ncbi:MAG: AAA family ATPase [Candidatus Electrothrix aestuarii]|uniref:AAA family ATPase n=1 Tax=Candidatus Electrothrix aestuarii TaxID=3062594 RepID=A0AAU8LX25_9BACT|nr:AAA family ATPase [Candidatus Electrothrix aestuarii]
MKKLGLGIQALSEFKDNDFIYVDKTKHIHRLIDDGKYYFLSRPRRFGKSLLINTLKELFEGNRRLFQGCWIEEKWHWQQKNPVIKIDFTQVEYRELGLKKALDQYLLRTAEQHKVSLEAETYALDYQVFSFALLASILTNTPLVG